MQSDYQSSWYIQLPFDFKGLLFIIWLILTIIMETISRDVLCPKWYIKSVFFVYKVESLTTEHISSTCGAVQTFKDFLLAVLYPWERAVACFNSLILDLEFKVTL
jgi:hypothetical protein